MALISMFPGGGIDPANKPQIIFDGKWSGWHVEFYGGKAYWEALFQTSGTLSVTGSYVADAWGIGGGGSGGGRKGMYGGGSGFTDMITNMTIIGDIAVTIGAGGETSNVDGGTTEFKSLSAIGGNCGANGCTGGSNGGDGSESPGCNGTPGEGYIMSKFRSVEHNTEFGKCGELMVDVGTGGGGYMEFGTERGHAGGYGAGGNGSSGDMSSAWNLSCGYSGCLMLRIKI